MPLIRLPSELSYGFEPHALFASRCPYGRCIGVVHVGRWCTRGGAGRVGAGEGYTGYYPPTDPEAGSTLIYGIIYLNRFIRPFDWIISNIILNLRQSWIWTWI